MSLITSRSLHPPPHILVEAAKDGEWGAFSNWMRMSICWRQAAGRIYIHCHTRHCEGPWCPNGVLWLATSQRLTGWRRLHLQVVAQKVCHGCALEKEAAAFMPDRRSKDGLMNYCRDCCLAGAPAAALPAARRPGRPPRSAAVIPLTHKARTTDPTRMPKEKHAM